MRRVVQVLHHTPRKRVGGGDEVAALLHVRVLVECQVLAGLDEEVDDLSQWNVEQRRQSSARRDEVIQIDWRSGEVDAQVTGPV